MYLLIFDFLLTFYRSRILLRPNRKNPQEIKRRMMMMWYTEHEIDLFVIRSSSLTKKVSSEKKSLNV